MEGQRPTKSPEGHEKAGRRSINNAGCLGLNRLYTKYEILNTKSLRRTASLALYHLGVSLSKIGSGHEKPIFWLKSPRFEHLNLGNLDLFRA
jgi:hypothetical protein